MEPAGQQPGPLRPSGPRAAASRRQAVAAGQRLGRRLGVEQEHVGDLGMVADRRQILGASAMRSALITWQPVAALIAATRSGVS